MRTAHYVKTLPTTLQANPYPYLKLFEEATQINSLHEILHVKLITICNWWPLRIMRSTLLKSQMKKWFNVIKVVIDIVLKR